MQICPTHNVLVQGECTSCAREFFALLGANELVHVRPPGITDDRDLPLPTGPTCDGMNNDSVGNEVLCERPPRHEGDCDDGTGLMWDHDETCGCFDEPSASG
jgi:hypothetical protein